MKMKANIIEKLKITVLAFFTAAFIFACLSVCSCSSNESLSASNKVDDTLSKDGYSSTKELCFPEGENREGYTFIGWECNGVIHVGGEKVDEPDNCYPVYKAQDIMAVLETQKEQRNTRKKH